MSLNCHEEKFSRGHRIWPELLPKDPSQPNLRWDLPIKK